jgi:hypothetical protein
MNTAAKATLRNNPIILFHHPSLSSTGFLKCKLLPLPTSPKRGKTIEKDLATGAN